MLQDSLKDLNQHFCSLTEIERQIETINVTTNHDGNEATFDIITEKLQCIQDFIRMSMEHLTHIKNLAAELQFLGKINRLAGLDRGSDIQVALDRLSELKSDKKIDEYIDNPKQLTELQEKLSKDVEALAKQQAIIKQQAEEETKQAKHALQEAASDQYKKLKGILDLMTQEIGSFEDHYRDTVKSVQMLPSTDTSSALCKVEAQQANICESITKVDHLCSKTENLHCNNKLLRSKKTRAQVFHAANIKDPEIEKQIQTQLDYAAQSRKKKGKELRIILEQKQEEMREINGIIELNNKIGAYIKQYQSFENKVTEFQGRMSSLEAEYNQDLQTVDAIVQRSSPMQSISTGDRQICEEIYIKRFGLLARTNEVSDIMKQVDAGSNFLDTQYKAIEQKAETFKLKQFIVPFLHSMKLVTPLKARETPIEDIRTRLKETIDKLLKLPSPLVQMLQLPPHTADTGDDDLLIFSDK